MFELRSGVKGESEWRDGKYAGSVERGCRQLGEIDIIILLLDLARLAGSIAQATSHRLPK